MVVRKSVELERDVLVKSVPKSAWWPCRYKITGGILSERGPEEKRTTTISI